MADETTTITIKDDTLKEAAAQGSVAFLDVFMEKYAEVIGEDMTAEKMALLNGHQHALYSYKVMRDEIEEGGFLLLIQEGYGPYIFDNPFAKAMRLFGAHRMSQLIYKAKKIYDAHKEELTADVETDEQYDKIMDTYGKKFEKIEDEMMVIEDEELDAVAHFVDENIELFAKIEQA